ncbi:MAG: PaaI family thioesterase [Aquabacterium sp.]|uniref:PaaI family thioesterase n=1 Tax=Aquabacterium sp. TaxID=1872578 RepID=UPI002A36A6D1|nr:PaaI family thioesterase [Aquabacterium sp.]MDX9844882.1 PaaI family thioesterase [Aquabacterium sp.]
MSTPADPSQPRSPSDAHATSSAVTHEVPAGFVPFHANSDTFIGLCGPIYWKDVPGGTPILGMRLQSQHMNLRGHPHGGLLVTLADSGLGYAVNHMRGGPLAVVTANLSTDFIGIAHLGDWIECHVEVDRIGARMAFASCHLKVGERKILRASGVFAIVKPVEPPPGGHVHGRLQGPASEAHPATPPTTPTA